MWLAFKTKALRWEDFEKRKIHTLSICSLHKKEIKTMNHLSIICYHFYTVCAKNVILKKSDNANISAVMRRTRCMHNEIHPFQITIGIAFLITVISSKKIWEAKKFKH